MRNKPAQFLWITISLLSIYSCKQEKMNFELKDKRELAGIPSASGIEVTNQGIFVIGDDSPWLFQINEDLQITGKTHLFPNRSFKDSILEKLQKPDLEALTRANETGNKLYSFGSGSKSPERDILIEIDLSGNISSREYSLVDFYTQLRAAAGISPEELNIEAAEIYKDHLYLFNRGRNLIIKYSLTEFSKYLEGGDVPGNPEIFNIKLPAISGITAGFSGASIDPENGKLFFTATVENTDNWIDDGEVLGSFIGIIDIDDLQNNLKPGNVGILVDEGFLKVKVESIALLPPFQLNSANLILVTDSDGGVSELLRGSLSY